MVRTHVQFTRQQLDALRELSTATGKSVDELVRKQQIDCALGVLGKFSSGPKDVSVHHDRYLVEAFKE